MVCKPEDGAVSLARDGAEEPVRFLLAQPRHMEA
jgi:hypothetical protein